MDIALDVAKVEWYELYCHEGVEELYRVSRLFSVSPEQQRILIQDLLQVVLPDGSEDLQILQGTVLTC